MALQLIDTNGRLAAGRGFRATMGDCSVDATYSQKFASREKPVHVMLVVDASGSMAGSPMRSVLNAIEDISRWLKNKQDSLSLWTFNDKVLNKLKPIGCKKVDFAKLRGDFENHVGGLTRLHDALYTVSKAWDPSKMTGCANFMVFLTDGGENNSKFKKHQVQREIGSLADSFDKLIFLTAGCGTRDVAYLEELLKDVRNKEKYIIKSADSNSGKNIQELFGFAQGVIEQVVIKYYHKGREVASTTFVAHGGGKQRQLAESALRDVNSKMREMKMTIKFH